MKTCTRKPTPPFIQTTTTALNALARVNKSFDADHIAEITEEADAVALVAERFYGIDVDFSEKLSKIKSVAKRHKVWQSATKCTKSNL
jgi:hypothetical protein